MVKLKKRLLMKRTILSLIVSAMLPAAAVAQPKLCGNLIHANGWTGSSYTDPYGIYSFNAADPSLKLSTEATGRYMDGTGGGVADNENLYLYNVEIEDGIASGHVYKMSREDYHSSSYGYIGSYADVPTALTWDASANKFYGCFYNYGGDAYQFGTVDLTVRRATKILISKISERMVALADNDEGTLYAIGKSGKLYTVNPVNGSFTEVGETGIKPSEKIQSAYYDEGTIYWAAQTDDGKSSLYKVDPATATATLVGDFPNGEQFSCLYKFKAAAEDGAPAAITELATNFEGPSLTGTLSFAMPTKTFAGEELTGELTWTVTKDGETIATGKANAGENVTTDPIAFANDYNSVQVYTENGVGRSPLYKTTFFAGPDTPASIGWGEAKLTVDDNRKATVTWPTVENGINGGYFVPEDVTYKLVRMPGEEVVADGLKGTTFTEQLPEGSGMTAYYYSVAAQFMGNEGYSTETNKVVVGSAYEVPFEEQFNDGALDYWTVLDQNQDYSTWWQTSGYVYSQAGWKNGSDDWLISPAIHLQPGRYYKLAFKYWGGLPDYEDYKGQTFEVGFGKGTDPAQYQTLGKKQDVIVKEEEAVEFSTVVKVDEDGNYNFGIHDISPSDSYLLYVDSLTVTEGGTMQVPAPIADLAAVAGADGKLEVELSFTAPAQTAEGKTLESIDKITIKRDGDNVVKVFQNPEPGKKLSFTDTAETGLTDGTHKYTVTSTNDKGESLEAETNVKVGIVAPGSVSEVKAVEQADGVLLTWNAPEKDSQGDAIDPSTLTYTITAVKYYTQEFNVVAEGVKGTSFVDKSFDLNTDDQFQACYVVQATNRAGSDEGIVSNSLIIGKPYQLPMTEGFSPEYGRQSKYLWWIDLTQDINTMLFFRFSTGMSSDNDNGCAAFLGAEGAYCNLRSGKICMEGAKKPEMKYDFYVDPELSMHANLAIEYSTDLSTWTEIDRMEYETLDDAQSAEWRTHTVDLTPLAQYPFVYVRLHGELLDGSSAIIVDNIRIQDDGTTGVTGVKAKSVKAKSGIYTLDGQLVSADTSAKVLRSLKPGMYAVGGRKVVVK